MKKIFIFFATVASVIFASCNKEYAAQDTPSTEKITRITASVPDAKTYLDGLQVKWSAGDKIQVVQDLTTYKAVSYSLTEGENTTTGTFEGQDAITAPYYAFSGHFYATVSKLFYYDIDATQKYVEGSISNNLIPMCASANSREVSFNHLASVLRFDVTVADTPGTISLKSISLKLATEKPYRFSLNMATGEPKPYSITTLEYNLSDLPATITKDATTTFYFVLPAGTLPGITFVVKDASNKTYSFEKASSITLEKGKMYKFTAITVSEPDIVPFLIQKNNSGTWENFYEEMDLSSVTSIKLKNNPAAEPKDIDDNFLSKLKGMLSSNPNIVTIDLSETVWYNTNIQTRLFKDFGACLGDLYLPSNIVNMEHDTYGMFNANPNLKLHISEDINAISVAVIFCSGGKMNAGTGIFVDANNKYYKSVDGVLYNKNCTQLHTLPERDTAYSMLETTTSLYMYGVSNNATLTSLTIPAGFTGQVDGKYIYNMRALEEIIYKRPASTTVDVILKALPEQDGSIKSPKYFRVPQSSLAVYQEALAGQLNGWTLVGYQEE